MTQSYTFQSARELFECARAADRDIGSIKRQLAEMEDRALSLGGSGFEQRVSSTATVDSLGRRVTSMVDKEDVLRNQMEQDYAIIDLANRVLYGDGLSSGLYSLMKWRARAIDLHYLNGMTWEQVAEVMGYTERHVYQQVQVAFEVCDGWGLVSVMQGRGGAEG